MARPHNERDGACICNYGPNTEGPDEECPFHGRPYAYWVERGDALQAQLAEAEERGAARMRERVEAVVDQWLAGTHDAAACQDFGCKDCVVVACDFDVRKALGGDS